MSFLDVRAEGAATTPDAGLTTLVGGEWRGTLHRRIGGR